MSEVGSLTQKRVPQPGRSSEAARVAVGCWDYLGDIGADVTIA